MTGNLFFELFLLLLVLVVVGAVVWYSYQQNRRPTTTDAYHEALEHLADGNQRLAIQQLKAAVKEDSENVAAYLRLGDVLRQKGMVAHAIRLHHELTLRGSLAAEERAKVYRSLLLDYDAAGDNGKALDIIEKIYDAGGTPEVWIVEKHIALLEHAGQWEKARAVVRRYQKILPEGYRHREALYLVFQGQRLAAEGHGKEARIKYKEALKADADCAAAYYYMGKSYLAEERADDALDAWKQLCRNIPGKAHIVFRELERTWFELGRFTDAENYYLELFSQPHTELRAGLALAEIYNKKGDFDSAIDIINKLQASHDNSPLVIRSKIDVFFKKGQYREAASQSMTLLNETNGAVGGGYHCRQCAFRSEEPQWICPKCESITSFDI